jgi:hypothetical protein
MLRLSSGQVESLWDEVLPDEVRELPEALAALDVLLQDPGIVGANRGVLAAALAGSWSPDDLDADVCAVDGGQAPHWLGVRDADAGGAGLASSAQVLPDRSGERVPDESTVRKLTCRLGAGVVNEITRVVIDNARREKRFGRGR